MNSTTRRKFAARISSLFKDESISVPATAGFSSRTEKGRRTRALKTIGIFWGLAFVFIFVPLLHFVLPALFFLAGPGVTYGVYGIKESGPRRRRRLPELRKAVSHRPGIFEVASERRLHGMPRRRDGQSHELKQRDSAFKTPSAVKAHSPQRFRRLKAGFPLRQRSTTPVASDCQKTLTHEIHEPRKRNIARSILRRAPPIL